VSTHKNVIEINGKLYDAKSGLLISGVVSKPHKVRSIDGVVKQKKALYEPIVVKPAPVTTPKTESIKPTEVASLLSPKPVRHRAVSAPVKHRAPQHSKTLMRRAVKKPQSQPISTSSEIQKSAHTFATQGRFARANTVAKNPFIRKFNDVSDQHLVKRAAPLAVKAAPSQVPEHKPQKSHTISDQRTNMHNTTISHHQTKSEKIFNDALEKAVVEPKVTSKKHAKKARRVGSRALRWGSAGLAGFLLLGFIGYMNITNINMQLASARAGFAASMPNYLPSGYRVSGPISFKPGQVTISFNSNTDQRNYKLTQEVSQWNSASLQENFLTSRNKQFETTQDAGRTIYLYDNGNATWVNAGVWYQIESNALSTDQLVKIASSL